MTETTPTSLREVLERAATLPWDRALYVGAPRSTWTMETSCLILDQDEVEQDEDYPLPEGYQYRLAVPDVQDVVVNARAQRADASLEDLLAALLYYYDNDAFITLGAVDKLD